MLTSLLGTKMKMGQTFTEAGMRIPVTVVALGPCYVVSIAKQPSYTLVQLGFGTQKHMNKAEIGHIKKAGLTQKFRFLRSIRVADLPEDWTVGKEVKIGDVFQVGDAIRVTGVSKAKGFQGVVKRHGFAGGPKTHGQSDRERAPGSIGQTTTPGRVYRGKRMAGRMGGEVVTVKGLRIAGIDEEKNSISIKGLIPGTKNSLVTVTKV